jgi:hypothetical protein
VVSTSSAGRDSIVIVSPDASFQSIVGDGSAT